MYKEASMPLLDDKIQAQVRKTLDGMAGPVKLVMFTQAAEALECELCAETRMLIEEIAALAPSGKLSVEVHDLIADDAAVGEYQVDKIPAIAVVGAKDYGIRFYGIPSGYEFSSLMDRLERRVWAFRFYQSRRRQTQQAGSHPGVCHAHLTVLSASRGARSSAGTRKPLDSCGYGGSDRVPAFGEQVPGIRRAAHRYQRDDPHRRRCARVYAYG
jgi:hypothetical protein